MCVRGYNARYLAEKGEKMKLKKLWPVGQADGLFFFCLGLGSILLLLGLLLFNLWVVASAALPLGYGCFRILSRNLSAREKEDASFQKAYRYCKKKVKKAADVLSYDEENLMRVCPECGEKVYFDECDGVFYTVCPMCGSRFLVDFS